jgi:signal transduction histidine kinase
MTDIILLVDDDPVFLKVVCRALEEAEYAVETAATGEEALRMATTTPYAVAVISLELRQGDGASLVRELARAVPQTECILLTADPDLLALVDLYDLGNVYNHHWKPLDEIGNLARDIARALERRALKRQNAYLLTELRDARDELRGQAEFMVQVEKLAALGQMAADLAEELETPMAALARYAGYLRRAIQDETARRRSHSFGNEYRTVQEASQESSRVSHGSGGEQAQPSARAVAGLTHAVERSLLPVQSHAPTCEVAGTRGHGDTGTRGRIGDCLTEMEQTAWQGHGLLGRIRAFSEGERAPLEPTDLREVIHETFGLLRHTLETRGVRLKAEIAAELPPILASAPRLQQALTHLVLNAVHAMPEGGTLTLSTEALSGESGGARLRLKDSGTGIEPEVLPRIFEPFYTTMPFRQGTGLGLTVARGIIREHDGEISIESALGQGTTVTLTFPAMVAMNPADAAGMAA